MRPISEIRVDNDELTSAPLPPSPFSDIPGPIWTGFLGAWALLFGLFVVFFATDGRATMAVLTACFFALMILGLPAAVAGQAGGFPKKNWDGRIVTHTGTIPIGAAATQIMLIPIASVIGVLCLVILAK